MFIGMIDNMEFTSSLMIASQTKTSSSTYFGIISWTTFIINNRNSDNDCNPTLGFYSIFGVRCTVQVDLTLYGTFPDQKDNNHVSTQRTRTRILRLYLAKHGHVYTVYGVLD